MNRHNNEILNGHHARQFLSYSVGPIIGSLFSAITVPITTNLLLPDEYGKTSMFVLLNSILLLVANFGFDQAYIREYYGYENKKKLLFNAMIVPLGISIFLLLPTIVFSADLSYFLFNDTGYRLPVIALAGTIPFVMMEKFLLNELRLSEKALRYSLFSLVNKFLTFIVTLYFLFEIRQDFLAIVYSSLIASYVSPIIMMAVCIRDVKKTDAVIDFGIIRQMGRFAIPVLPAAVISSLFNAEDKVLLRQLSTYTELGYYQASMTLSNIIGIVYTAFASFWTPLSFKWHEKGRPVSDFEAVQRMICFLASLLYIAVVICKGLIPILLSNNYYQTKYILPMLLFYPVSSLMISVISIGINFSRKTQFFLYISIVVMVANFVLNCVFIPLFGAVGAALATGLSHILDLGLKTYFSRKTWSKFAYKHMAVSVSILLTLGIINSYEMAGGIVIYLADGLAALLLCWIYKGELKSIIEIIGRRKIG